MVDATAIIKSFSGPFNISNTQNKKKITIKNDGDDNNKAFASSVFFVNFAISFGTHTQTYAYIYYTNGSPEINDWWQQEEATGWLVSKSPPRSSWHIAVRLDVHSSCKHPDNLGHGMCTRMLILRCAVCVHIHSIFLVRLFENF